MYIQSPVSGKILWFITFPNGLSKEKVEEKKKANIKEKEEKLKGDDEKKEEKWTNVEKFKILTG